MVRVAARRRACPSAGELRDHAAADAAIGAGGVDVQSQLIALASQRGRLRGAARSSRMRPSSTRSGHGCARVPHPAPCASPVSRQIDPVVQRAGDACAVHDALAQRPALVRAAVVEREDLVVRRAEHRDRRRAACARTRAPRRGMSIERADVDPGLHRPHCRRLRRSRRSAIGVNSCASLPATRSAQGSTCAKFCEKTKRS